MGPGGLEPATRPLSAPTAGKFRIRRDERGIEDGRRKDWHSAANQAVVSSSWGDCLSGILPRRLDAEAGLWWCRRETRAATPEDPGSRSPRSAESKLYGLAGTLVWLCTLF